MIHMMIKIKATVGENNIGAPKIWNNPIIDFSYIAIAILGFSLLLFLSYRS